MLCDICTHNYWEKKKKKKISIGEDKLVENKNLVSLNYFFVCGVEIVILNYPSLFLAFVSNQWDIEIKINWYIFHIYMGWNQFFETMFWNYGLKGWPYKLKSWFWVCEIVSSTMVSSVSVYIFKNVFCILEFVVYWLELIILPIFLGVCHMLFEYAFGIWTNIFFFIIKLCLYKTICNIIGHIYSVEAHISIVEEYFCYII